MNIKVLIFDLWNTLIYDDAKFAQDKIAQFLDFPNRQSFWRYCDKNYFSKSQKFTDFLIELCRSRNLSDKKCNKLVDLWVKTRELTKIYPDSISLLKKLRGRYKLMILSNSSEDEGGLALTKFGLKKYFDKIILSCDVGLSKPDISFFNIPLKYFGMKPSEFCIIGDDYENDMIPAKKMGFKTILLDREKIFGDVKDVDVVINSLNEVVDILKG
jgi:putative hydrolase of the HAD superfamily